MIPDMMAMIAEIQNIASPIFNKQFEFRIFEKIINERESICVAVLHFDKQDVLKFFPESSVASLTPEIIISRQSIIAAGIIV